MARFTTLYSGSSGNCAVIEQDGKYLLVDMGGSCKATMAGLAGLGLPLEGLLGILLTHEHIDHVRGLPVFLKKRPVPLVGSSATLDALMQSAQLPQALPLIKAEGAAPVLGGFSIKAFPVSHDTKGCCGFRVTVPGGAVAAIATDLGKMTAEVFVQLEGAALVALEANYDRIMLQNGSYPPALKKRIASVTGHLSNDDAAATVAQLISLGCTRISLCHLSQENNHPRQVRAAVDATLFKMGLSLPSGVLVQVAKRHQASEWMDFYPKIC